MSVTEAEADDSCDKLDEDGESISSLRSNSLRSNKPQKQLKCKMLVNAKDVTFQVDKGASVNTLPVKYAPVSAWKVSDTTLTMWNGTIMKPLGKYRASVTNPRNLKRYDIE
jgi:hypothetical protein